MASIINLGLRAFQFFWTVLIIALVGNMIAEAKSGNPSIINYVMFTAVFSILSLFYLIVATIKEEFAIAPLFMLVADALNVLFFFCGGVALAAKLGAHSCGNSDYVKSNGVTNGADNMKKRCQEAQATTAFLWFAFAAYCGSLFFSFLATKGSTTPRPSIIRSRGGPAMSQV